MKIVGTKNARKGVEKGMHILRNAGTAIDAVEKAIRVIEETANDWSVGYGAFPNLLGTVELDASIMEGRTLNAGAVAAIQNFMHPISIARKVMEELPHVLLVGEGAERFAEQYQFEKTKLLTEEIKRQYREFEKGGVPILTRKERIDDLSEEEIEEKREWMRKYLEDHRIREFYERFKLEAHGTVNVIALDEEGNMCAGVSTSGTPLKIPGRVGDTPLIGAGNYVDNRYGGAACTGHGELAIQLSSARMAVFNRKRGQNVREACENTVKALDHINLENDGLTVLMLDEQGRVCSASNRRVPTYHVFSAKMDEPEKRKGVKVEL